VPKARFGYGVLRRHGRLPSRFFLFPFDAVIMRRMSNSAAAAAAAAACS